MDELLLLESGGYLLLESGGRLIVGGDATGEDQKMTGLYRRSSANSSTPLNTPGISRLAARAVRRG